MNITENLIPLAGIFALLPVAVVTGWTALKTTLHPTAAQMQESE